MTRTPTNAAWAEVAARDLGGLQACERPAFVPRALVITLMLFTVALALGTIAFIVSSVVEAHRNAWATDTRSLVLFDGMMLLLVGALALPARFALQSLGRWLPNPTVSVFERGMVYDSRGRVRSLRWDELTEVTFRIVRVNVYTLFRTTTSTSYSVVLRAGNRKFVLTESLVLTANILATARRAVTDRALEPTHARLQSGETVTFGRVVLGPDALRLGKRAIRWADLRHVDVERGFFVAATARRRFVEPVDRIPNLDLLVALCHQALA